MSARVTTIDRVRRYYGTLAEWPLLREFFDGSDYLNFGYWREHTQNAREAHDNLMDVLLGLLPEKAGSILDVACGTGATTRHLLKYYRPADVTAINISEQQLATCRLNAPGCTFILMDAATLGFPDESFNALICVEAAFHFNTRLRFLKEAYRVLKPGGVIVLSDVLTSTPPTNSLLDILPQANYVASVRDYEAVWREAGFPAVHVLDATAEVWQAFCEHLARWVEGKHLDRRNAQLVSLFLDNRYNIQQYVLVSASKERIAGHADP